jgi:hypothetical protein
MNADLVDAIEELYAVFARHPLAARIEYCGHCVGDEEALVLQRKALRELTADDLERFTFRVLSTWGDEADLRHFLPRILELFATGEQLDGYLLTKTVGNVRCYGGKWPQDERDAVERYLLALWRQVLSDSDSPIRPVEVLEGAAMYGHSIEPYLRLWEDLTGADADLQLAWIIDELHHVSSDDRYRREIDAWLRSGFPARRLEAAFLAASDAKTAGWFGQALEQLELMLFKP